MHRLSIRVLAAAGLLFAACAADAPARAAEAEAPEEVKKYVRWGAGPRASQYLALGGKVLAAVSGRFNVAAEDVVKVALPVLRHRVLLNYHAEADQRSVESIIQQVIRTVK